MKNKLRAKQKKVSCKNMNKKVDLDLNEYSVLGKAPSIER